MSDSELDFQYAYNDFKPKIYRYLKRLVGEHEAEDLTQDVFFKISKGLKGFRGESNLNTWIYRIATNSALDKLRSKSFQLRSSKKFKESLNEIDIKDAKIKDTSMRGATLSVDEQLIKKEMNECIRNFIDHLPDDYRYVMVLSELEGLKNREIAEILEVAIDTVKVRLHRARTKLKKKLENNCSFYRNKQNELACDRKRTI